MTSVHLRPHAGDKPQPVLGKAVDLLRLDRVLLGYAFQLLDFIRHDLQVMRRHLASRHHGVVPMKGAAAEDNALIGFFGCHPRKFALNARTVNWPPKP